VPGEFVASDPKGRAIMIGAVEKQKFVYILNRDSQNLLTISSPLEAHKAHMLTLQIVGVDVGIENPQFACLEIDYGDADQQHSAVNTNIIQKALTFYEMDLGLNHVIRKAILPVDRSAHLLVAVPGDDGPGGILVICEDFVVYKKVGHDERKCFFPQRNDLALVKKQNNERKLFITSSATFSLGPSFFFLL
jgi:splicing factor 3B subunit 3